MVRNEKGFSLAELVVVVATIAFLTWVVLPRDYVVNASLGAAAYKIQSDIRYAQELAMTKGTRHQIRFFSSTNRYDVVTASGQPVANPLTGDGSYVMDFNAGAFPGVQLSSTVTVEFDSLGRPNAGQTISLNAGARVVTVTAETGLVTL